MKNRAFTLVEIMIVVVIISILVTLAIPSYYKTVENAKKREAEATLRTIYAAEKVYRTERQKYVTDTDWDALNMENPNRNDGNFTYNFVGTDTTFSATATRSRGANSGGTITIDEQENVEIKY